MCFVVKPLYQKAGEGFNFHLSLQYGYFYLEAVFMKTVLKIVLSVATGLVVFRLLQICFETNCDSINRKYISREIDLNS